MKLSIIIPYYNVPCEYTDELLECLDKQINPLGDTVTMNPDVEVILIDDGSKTPYKPSYPWLKVIRQKNKGAGATRNKGIDKSKSEYITFIDADDMVAPNYIERILDKIEGGFDVCDMSWKSLTLNGVQFNYKLKSDTDRLSNPSVCTRVFNRSYIGTIRFSEVKDAAEDEDFSRRLGYLTDTHKHTAITDYMYFYRTDVTDSNTKTFKQGLRKTKRIVYYFNHFRADMLDELEQIKKDDELNEVILLTNKCDMPEVRRYAQVYSPTRIWTHYLKGEPYTNIEIIQPPFHTQVVLYIHQTNIIGGIETFILNFAKIMSKFYDITFVVNVCPDTLVAKIAQYIRVIKGQPNKTIICDTLIMLRILDTKPENIKAKQSIQMCHACRTNPQWHIPQDSDCIVNVSESSKVSFGEESKDAVVIHNLIDVKPRKTLFLMSATRMPAPDKGQYEIRIRRLCEMLDEADIPFIWLNFSEGKLSDAPIGFYNVGLSDCIQDYMQKADYIVQLSDSEAFSYTILEALTINKPVIVTPFPSTADMGIKSGINGYIVPFNMDFDVKMLLDIPQFEYEYDVEKIADQWKKLLGKSSPENDYHPQPMVRVRVTQTYRDIAMNLELKRGLILNMTKERAETVAKRGFLEILGG